MLGLRDKAKGLEAELQGFEVRHAGVVRRLADATARHEAAIADQRRFLVETDGADAKVAKAVADACRKAADDRAALEDAARTLAGTIKAARAKLAAERDRRERDRAAGEVEAGAVAIEKAAARLDEAAAVFDRANVALAAVSREHAPRDPLLGHGPEAGYLAAAGRLAGVLPRENIYASVPGFEQHIGAVPAAAVTVGQMRARAKAIREGAASPVKPAPPVEWPRAAAFPEVVTVLSVPAFYRNYLGQRIDLPQPGGVTVPEPIAAEAARLGVGFGPESVPGRAILRIVRTMPSARIEADSTGSFRGVAFTGQLGEGGKGLPPSPEPTDLGMLPDFSGVMIQAAAQ